MYSMQCIKKVCSFCVSDLHLITMLLPYLDKKIKEDEKFITVLEKDLTEEVKLVLSRITLNNEDKNGLLNINWNNKEISEIEQIQREFIKTCKVSNKINIVVNGGKEYIEIVNKELNKLLGAMKMENSVRIINCYDITKLDEDIKPILRTHDIILNTSGEKRISEVFEGYEKQKGA